MTTKVFDFLKYIRNHNLSALLSSIYIVVMVVFALAGSWLAPTDPNLVGASPFETPSLQHLLGTDDLGRDVLSRLIDGTSISVRAAFQTVFLAVLIGVPIGLLAGYRGRSFDSFVMRLMDALDSFPALVLALVVAAVLGPGLTNAMLAITIVITPLFVRLARAVTLNLVNELYVEASRLIGTRSSTILRRQILPGVLSPVIVNASVMLGIAMTAEASLSFLGLGAQAPSASWGNMLRSGFKTIYTQPALVVAPATLIAGAILSFNLLGDALRDFMGRSYMPATPSGSRKTAVPLGVTLVAPREAGDESSRSPRPIDPQPGDGSELPELLYVQELCVDLKTAAGTVPVVKDISFTLGRGEIVALVGESGSGKTVTAQALMRLLSSPPAVITSGSIWYDRDDILSLRRRDLEKLRGMEISMVFQDAMASLNPSFTIGNQLAEALRLHTDASLKGARDRSLELLDLVGVSDGEQRLKQYPHHLSGGMLQRVAIAMALVNEPKLLIADEPTTALDVTIQAQILALLHELRAEIGLSILIVTHDLGVVATLADRALVMHRGRIVEAREVHDLFREPQHWYTRHLLLASERQAPQILDETAVWRLPKGDLSRERLPIE